MGRGSCRSCLDRWWLGFNEAWGAGGQEWAAAAKGDEKKGKGKNGEEKERINGKGKRERQKGKDCEKGNGGKR